MKKIIMSLVSCLVFSFIHANIGPNGFKAFPNYYFVETGTFGGDGVLRALRDGFKEVRSIESDRGLYNAAKKECSRFKNVRLALGDSAKDLWDLIKDIEGEITFWLDAHSCPPRTDGGKNCPLIEELEQIGYHHIKTHTIIIDDMLCAGTILFDWLTKDDLIRKIKEINPNYVISYINGGNEDEYPDNIMVARVP